MENLDDSKEVERKFLVTSQEYRVEASNKERIVQAFLNTAPERTVRVRIKGEKGFLTVKGPSTEDGTERFEWETVISIKEAESLLPYCEEGTIEKVRYEVPSENHTFEIDEFMGDNEGLIVAEIELKHKDEPFAKPAWLGKEVTGDVRYYNSNLTKDPYKNWK